jgi:hypothetical protein
MIQFELLRERGILIVSKRAPAATGEIGSEIRERLSLGSTEFPWQSRPLRRSGYASNKNSGRQQPYGIPIQ